MSGRYSDGRYAELSRTRPSAVFIITFLFNGVQRSYGLARDPIPRRAGPERFLTRVDEHAHWNPIQHVFGSKNKSNSSSANSSSTNSNLTGLTGNITALPNSTVSSPVDWIYGVAGYNITEAQKDIVDGYTVTNSTATPAPGTTTLTPYEAATEAPTASVMPPAAAAPLDQPTDFPPTETLAPLNQPDGYLPLPGSMPPSSSFPPPDEVPGTPETFMTAAASAGDLEIQVASTLGFNVGDEILVGGQENTINGFGSIILGFPLAQDMPVGTSIMKKVPVQAESTTNSPNPAEIGTPEAESTTNSPNPAETGTPETVTSMSETTTLEPPLVSGGTTGTIGTPAESSGTTTGPPQVPETVLTAAALKGDVEIQVASTLGFNIGDEIFIGTQENTITGFGSILLSIPLQQDMPMNTPIRLKVPGEALPTTNTPDQEETTTSMSATTFGPEAGGTTQSVQTGTTGSSEGTTNQGTTGVPDAAPGSTTGAETTSGPPLQVIETFLSAPAKAGDTEIQVESTDGFSIGDYISVGNQETMIEGFGSMIIKDPLKEDLPKGAQIRKLQAPASTSNPADSSTSISPEGTTTNPGGTTSVSEGTTMSETASEPSASTTTSAEPPMPTTSSSMSETEGTTARETTTSEVSEETTTNEASTMTEDKTSTTASEDETTTAEEEAGSTTESPPDETTTTASEDETTATEEETTTTESPTESPTEVTTTTVSPTESPTVVTTTTEYSATTA